VNEVVQLFYDRGIVPFAVEGVNGDDGEQYRGRNLKPMFGDPLHAYQASFARFKEHPGACSRDSELGEVWHNSTDSVSLTLPAHERGVTMNGNFKLTVPPINTRFRRLAPVCQEKGPVSWTAAGDGMRRL
jgi:hypothetical protein